MKLLSTIFALLLAPALCFSQIDCKPYVPTKKGATWEITNYSQKGKQTGKIAYELIDKVEDGNTITFTIKNVTYDDKGKEIFSNTYNAKCVDGEFEFDMAYKMNGESLKAYQNMDVEIDASEFEIPSMDASPGTILDDGTLEVGIGADGASMFKMTIFITDRKIEAKENITTPAGSFDCIVLSQNVTTKMIVNVKGSSKEWYAENVGLVRSESYNKKGKLMGYSELTMFNNQ